MDDGSYTGSGLRLSTHSFSLEELDLLKKALASNLSIVDSINTHNKEKEQYALYITKNQLPLVRDLVIKYIHPDMLYKLNVNKK